MATTTVKSTYSLDVATVRQLEKLAERWHTSKSGALRRAIRAAAKQALPAENEGLDALDRLQRLLALDRASGTVWEVRTRQERRAGGQRSHRSVPP